MSAIVTRLPRRDGSCTGGTLARRRLR
jgi:hypothetical protein